MSKFKIFFFLQSLFFLSLPVLAQVDTGWVRRYSGGYAYDLATALAVDDSGNVYVTGHSGYSEDFGSYSEYVTIKYAPDGDSIWVRTFKGNAKAYALAVDDAGNVYVTGASICGSVFCFEADYVTIKYAPSGDILWIRSYSGPGISWDIASALAVDDSGNVYVTGNTATIKYFPDGDTAWVRSYGGVDLAVDNSGNVYVTGGSWNGANEDYATIKYAPNGDTLWVIRYDGPGNYDDGASALAVDTAGNVYVTGQSEGSGTHSDYATIKYASNGDTLWVRRYDGPGNANDVANALVLDAAGNVYVTGYSWSGVSNDYATIKYAPSGDTLWVRRYNGPGNSYDYANALAVDDSGNVYVTGNTATIKYFPDGDTAWVRSYGGVALAVDNSGNVYVTGGSEGGGTYFNYVTIKYNKFGCAAIAGDVNSDYKVDLADIMLQINYLFKAGAKPDPFCSGDANANGNILLTDIVYLINYIFRSGLAPVKSNECCL